LSITFVVSGVLYGVFSILIYFSGIGPILSIFCAGVATLFAFGAVLRVIRYDFCDTLYGSIGGALIWAGIHLWLIGYADSNGYLVYPAPFGMGVFFMLLSCWDEFFTEADYKEFKKLHWRRR
jgi:hypothetical protein